MCCFTPTPSLLFPEEQGRITSHFLDHQIRIPTDFRSTWSPRTVSPTETSNCIEYIDSTPSARSLGLRPLPYRRYFPALSLTFPFSQRALPDNHLIHYGAQSQCLRSTGKTTIASGSGSGAQERQLNGRRKGERMPVAAICQLLQPGRLLTYRTATFETSLEALVGGSLGSRHPPSEARSMTYLLQKLKLPKGN